MATEVKVKVAMGDLPAEEFIIHPGQDAERKVRLEFNPNQNPEVALMKAICAAGIAYVDRTGGDPRLTALAKTTLEEASMWAVKSITA